MPPATTETITAMVSEVCTRVAAARPPISAAAITSSAQPSWAGPTVGRAGRDGAGSGACLGPGLRRPWELIGRPGGGWEVRRNVTSWGPVLTSAAEQIQPASTCVVRTALTQPIGGSTHTWYCPAGTFTANSRAEFRVPDTTLVSVPSASTFTWLPETLRPSVPSSTTLTVSLRAAPWWRSAGAGWCWRWRSGWPRARVRPSSMRGR